jgi:hypothetical protein
VAKRVRTPVLKLFLVNRNGKAVEYKKVPKDFERPGEAGIVRDRWIYRDCWIWAMSEVEARRVAWVSEVFKRWGKLSVFNERSWACKACAV